MAKKDTMGAGLNTSCCRPGLESVVAKRDDETERRNSRVDDIEPGNQGQLHVEVERSSTR